ncbi:MAG: sulfatase [Planctomycetota bacterium]|nr:sulfatase [Planctomycetota bacterium]
MRLPETLGLALRAGLGLGALFGLVDGVVAASLTSAALTPLSLAACLSAAVFEYCALAVGALGLLGLVFHPALSRWSRLARLQGFVALGLSAGLFAELYWWTRPFVFYGRPAFSMERVLASLALLAVALLVARVLARPLAAQLEKLGWFLQAPVVAAFLAGGAYLVAQRDVLAGHGVPNERTRDMPNVMLVVVDALRQDTLGCYGHPRVKSPNIDRLAREGVLFENSFTQAPFTWTSFGSMLTGKYPRRHGLVKMAPGTRMVENTTIASHVENATRVDGRSLRDDDYLSVSFHTGTLSSGSGLIQGFDLYYEQLAGHGLVVAESAWSVFRSDLLLHVLRSKFEQKAGGDVAGTAREWLAENGQRRFLSMVHLYSTHTPYDPPRVFRDMYVDPSYAGPVKAFYAQHREAIERGDVVPTPADIAQIQNLYYAGVSQADAAIGALMAELERLGTLDDTLVIVTADHGESLGEMDFGQKMPLWEHNHMVNTNLRIPLVMRWPKGLPAGQRVSAIVDEIDILPTVCDLLRIVLPAETDRYSKIDGASLVPLAHGAAASVREFSFAENQTFASIQDARWKLLVPFDLITRDDWATGRAANGLPIVLLDLVQDPGEQRNVAAAEPAQAARLHAALRAWFAEMPEIRIEFSPRDLEEQKRLLEALGYTDSGTAIGDAPPKPGR